MLRNSKQGAFQNAMDNTSSAYDNLLENIQTAIAPPTETGSTYLCRGPFKYFHYKCEGFNDVGWGCAYRTLQSICSLIIAEQNLNDELQCVPTIPQIQETLVSISDKPQSFLGSREWIGALEVFYVIDTLYNISCKIQHVPKTEDLKKYANVVKKYFEDWGGLIMMGGDVDASSKGIAGVHIAGNEAYFLVVVSVISQILFSFSNFIHDTGSTLCWEAKKRTRAYR